jgi:hypothetical protein
MEKTFSKIQSQYLFYAKWNDAKNNEQFSVVKLIIDYENQSFSIMPEKQSNDKFLFINANENTSKKWFAVTEAIIEANKFATKELGFTQ